MTLQGILRWGPGEPPFLSVAEIQLAVSLNVEHAENPIAAKEKMRPAVNDALYERLDPKMLPGEEKSFFNLTQFQS